MYVYLLIGSLGIGFGLFYKKELTNYLLSSLWHTTRYYHKTAIYLEENDYINNTINKEEEEKKTNYIIQYNSKKNKTIIQSIFKYNIFKETDLIVININDVYKIIEKNDNIEGQIYCLFQPIKKLFLQVDFIQNNKSIEINDNLQKFYLKDNIILDEVFMKWFMN